jgi:PilZ domain
MWGTGKGIERRAAPRESGPFAAVLKLYNGQSLPCTVINVSETGAKLALVKETVLPKQFELAIPSKNAFWRVRVVWQDGKQLGVCRT